MRLINTAPAPVVFLACKLGWDSVTQQARSYPLGCAIISGVEDDFDSVDLPWIRGQDLTGPVNAHLIKDCTASQGLPISMKVEASEL